MTKKKEIVNNGIALFKAYGYDNVTVQQIAKESGISKNTFYYYFDNKEDIIRSAFFKGHEDRTSILSKVVQETNPYNQLLCFIKPELEQMESLGKEVVKKALILNLGGSLVPDYKPSEEKKQKHEEIAQMLDAIIKRGQEQHCIRSDIDTKEILRTLGALVIGCVQIWATADHDFSLREMALNHIKVVLTSEQTQTNA